MKCASPARSAVTQIDPCRHLDSSKAKNDAKRLACHLERPRYLAVVWHQCGEFSKHDTFAVARLTNTFPTPCIGILFYAVGDLFVNRAIARHRHQGLTLASVVVVVVAIACCCRPQGHDTRNANVRWREVFFPPLPLGSCVSQHYAV